jgi:hypothetical protein
MEAEAWDTLLAVDMSVTPPPVVDMIVMENPLAEGMVEMRCHLRGTISEALPGRFECPIRATAGQNLRRAVTEIRDERHGVPCCLQIHCYTADTRHRREARCTSLFSERHW